MGTSEVSMIYPILGIRGSHNQSVIVPTRTAPFWTNRHKKCLLSATSLPQPKIGPKIPVFSWCPSAMSLSPRGDFLPKPITTRYHNPRGAIGERLGTLMTGLLLGNGQDCNFAADTPALEFGLFRYPSAETSPGLVSRNPLRVGIHGQLSPPH